MKEREGQRERGGDREEENTEELTQSFDKQHGEGAAFPPTANELVYIRFPPSPLYLPVPVPTTVLAVLVRARAGIRVCICVGQFFIPVLIVILAVRQIAHTLRVRCECHSTVASLCRSVQPLNLLPTVPATAPHPSIHSCRCSLSKCQNSLS